jgi:PPK2 family polyphosphate:nucleotide phosphotransferase
VARQSRVERWLVRPGRAPGLAQRDPGSTDGAPGDRQTTEVASFTQSTELMALQDRLWAEAKRSLLVVLQGVDASGKDGTIKHVFRGVNPQGVRVMSFKEPTHLELAHDFLWRVHQHVPVAGEIGIFNRSHYEDVLAVRVHGLAPESRWRPRYEDIAAFERLLHREGTAVVKICLHVSFEEQGARLEERVHRPDKRWKISRSDFSDRDRWAEFQEAYEEAIERTSTPHAPWYVVPADHKWYRNWVIGEILLHTLEEMDPLDPEAPPLNGAGA